MTENVKAKTMNIDEKYPARNRAKNALSALSVQIEYNDGVTDFTPSALKNACANHPESGFDFAPIPGTRSVISDQPACMYRTHEVEIALTWDEIIDMTLGRMRADDVEKLAWHFGAFREIRNALDAHV